MRSIHTKGNWYIRRRLTYWDSASRRDMPYVGPSPAPTGFLSLLDSNTVFPGGAINASLGGAMTHIGDGWWEKKILGSDLATYAAALEGAFEIVVLDTLQYHDAEEVKFYARRIPGMA